MKELSITIISLLLLLSFSSCETWPYERKLSYQLYKEKPGYIPVKYRSKRRRMTVNEKAYNMWVYEHWVEKGVVYYFGCKPDSGMGRVTIKMFLDGDLVDEKSCDGCGDSLVIYGKTPRMVEI